MFFKRGLDKPGERQTTAIQAGCGGDLKGSPYCWKSRRVTAGGDHLTAMLVRWE